MLFPVYLAYKADLPYVVAALFLCMFSSMFYHIDEKNPHGLYADLVGVIVLVTTLFFLLFQLSAYFTFINVLAIVYGLMAVFYFMKAQEGITENSTGEREFDEVYEFYHMAWHILAACLVAIVIYSYSNHLTFLTKPIPTHITSMGVGLSEKMRNTCCQWCYQWRQADDGLYEDSKDSKGLMHDRLYNKG